MKDYYIHLSSKKSDIHNGNSFRDFTVSLPQLIHFHGEWEIGLAQVSYSREKTKFPDMYLCSDISSPRPTSDGYHGILRYLPNKFNAVREDYSIIQYSDLIGSHVQHIRIYLINADSSAKKTSFEDSTLYCTLHIRQKK